MGIPVGARHRVWRLLLGSTFVGDLPNKKPRDPRGSRGSGINLVAAQKLKPTPTFHVNWPSLKRSSRLRALRKNQPYSAIAKTKVRVCT